MIWLNLVLLVFSSDSSTLVHMSCEFCGTGNFWLLQHLVKNAHLTCGTWWSIGWVDSFQPESRGFDSHSSHHVGTLGKSLAHSCLWRFGVKLRHSIRAMSGALLSKSDLKRRYRNGLNEWMDKWILCQTLAARTKKPCHCVQIRFTVMWMMHCISHYYMWDSIAWSGWTFKIWTDLLTTLLATPSVVSGIMEAANEY